MNDHFQGLTGRVGRIGELLREIGEEAHEVSEEAEGLTERTPAAAVSILGRFATRVRPKVDDLEEIAIEYEDLVVRVDDALITILDNMERGDHDHEDLGERLVFLSAIIEMGDQVHDAYTSLTSMADTTKGVSDLSRVVRPVLRRLRAAIARVTSTEGMMDVWVARASVLHERWSS
jgi:hypothetical protein